MAIRCGSVVVALVGRTLEGCDSGGSSSESESASESEEDEEDEEGGAGFVGFGKAFCASVGNATAPFDTGWGGGGAESLRGVRDGPLALMLHNQKHVSSRSTRVLPNSRTLEYRWPAGPLWSAAAPRRPATAKLTGSNIAQGDSGKRAKPAHAHHKHPSTFHKPRLLTLQLQLDLRSSSQHLLRERSQLADGCRRTGNREPGAQGR